MFTFYATAQMDSDRSKEVFNVKYRGILIKNFFDIFFKLFKYIDYVVAMFSIFESLIQT